MTSCLFHRQVPFHAPPICPTVTFSPLCEMADALPSCCKSNLNFPEQNPAGWQHRWKNGKWGLQVTNLNADGVIYQRVAYVFFIRMSWIQRGKKKVSHFLPRTTLFCPCFICFYYFLSPASVGNESCVNFCPISTAVKLWLMCRMSERKKKVDTCNQNQPCVLEGV